MLSWDLEDWITETGAALVERHFLDPQSLTPQETLLFEIWLLDTEARNGGLSQYFLNRGITQWLKCISAARDGGLSAFAPFVDATNAIIGSSSDPYDAINSAGDSAENLWYTYQPAVIKQLMELHRGAL